MNQQHTRWYVLQCGSSPDVMSLLTTLAVTFYQPRDSVHVEYCYYIKLLVPLKY